MIRLRNRITITQYINPCPCGAVWGKVAHTDFCADAYGGRGWAQIGTLAENDPRSLRRAISDQIT